jgi:hypothetical protein
MAIFNCMYYLQAHFQLEGYLIGSREKETEVGKVCVKGGFLINWVVCTSISTSLSDHVMKGLID